MNESVQKRVECSIMLFKNFAVHIFKNFSNPAVGFAYEPFITVRKKLK